MRIDGPFCRHRLLLACGTARAQDTGKAGVTLAYPASIGVIWHAGDNVAIRPDFTFSHSSTDGSLQRERQ